MTDPADVTTLPVEFLGTLRARTEPIPAIPVSGPAGTRVTVTVTDVTFDGPKLTAVGPEGVAAADWALVRSDGSLVLDVRLNLRTTDEADIYVTYTGIGVSGEDGTMSIRTAPLFETGDERYAWLNQVQAVGIGRTTDGGVEYDVYALC
jgi:hypothetical protein